MQQQPMRSLNSFMILCVEVAVLVIWRTRSIRKLGYLARTPTAIYLYENKYFADLVNRQSSLVRHHAIEPSSPVG
jgi:hypothetical protein